MARSSLLPTLLAGLLSLGAAWIGEARAEALVFIHGYLGDGDDWREQGLTTALERSGWGDGGRLSLSDGRVALRSGTGAPGPRFYTLDLQSGAPLTRQARDFTAYMAFVRRRHPGESLFLVGHSAGGVLGRLYMVQHPESGVGVLVTIASPHLGTEAAELGVTASRGPLSWFSHLIGEGGFPGTQGLFHDLVRERPGSLLFWLNRQEHPPARYVSVVRREKPFFLGDFLVPEWSQDMNQVYALRGRSVRIATAGTHGLSPDDGMLLVRILARLRGS